MGQAVKILKVALFNGGKLSKEEAWDIFINFGFVDMKNEDLLEKKQIGQIMRKWVAQEYLVFTP